MLDLLTEKEDMISVFINVQFYVRLFSMPVLAEQWVDCTLVSVFWDIRKNTAIKIWNEILSFQMTESSV